MEISYLDYERTKITDPNHPFDPSSFNNDEVETGSIQYDPNEKVILFYSSTSKFSFMIPISEITILSEFLNRNRIAFTYNEYLIQIYNQKKETLGEKTMKLLYNVLARKVKNETKKIIKDSKHIITKPTAYQNELLEEAKKKNIIVFLETGLGKTYISILLIKEIFGEPQESNSINEVRYVKKTNKKVLYLFKTVGLLLQQAKVIKQNTNLKILKLYGNSDNANLYLHSKFKKTLAKKDIICATAESVYRYFTFGYLSNEDFAAVVVDECHHCRKEDFYNKLLKHFIFFDDKGKDVKILGLTASPCADKVDNEIQLKNNIVDLCNNMNCYLACPRNIFESEMKEKVEDKAIELIILHENIDDEKEKNKQIIFYIFSNVILPVLDFHCEKIYNEITKSFIDKNEANETNEEERKAKKKNEKENKTEIKLNLAIIIMMNLCTMFINEENKLDEKYMGIFSLKDIDILSEYREYNIKNDKKFFFIKEKILARIIEKLKSQSEFSFESDKINYSREIAPIEKRIKNDSIIGDMRKYSKNINLLIKFAEISAIDRYTKETFEIIEKKIYDIHHDEIQEYESSNDESMINLISMKFIESKKIKERFPSFISTTFKSIFCFAKNQEEKSKTILFVNHRRVARELCRSIQQISEEKNCGIVCGYVVGISNAKPSFSFTETELKKVLNNFANEDEFKLLIATNVIEEGIDVPQCNNVICLSEITTPKEFIQKTGRARKQNSKVYFFSRENEQESKVQNINQIKLSIKVMKDLISKTEITPTMKRERYVQNYNYYQTICNSRVFLNYASKVVNEFISKLFNDGYNFVHTAFKTEQINKDKTIIGYKPYLSLPSVLECSFQKIYDNDNKIFPTEKEAKQYLEKYQDYYYLKALILLHKNLYLDDFLQFNKNYDDLISMENNFVKCESESRVSIKTLTNHPKEENDDFVLTANVLKLTPGYFDINYNEPVQRSIALLSLNPLSLVNFDLFIPSNLLLKLYYFNTHFSEDDEEEIAKWFGKKPKIPYTVFSKLNIGIDKTMSIKVPKDKIHLINFFYIYSLFVSTDAEMFFYYAVYMKKFNFCKFLFTDGSLQNQLKDIFQYYDIDYLSIKHHLKLFCESKLSYEDHIVKFSLIIFDQKTNSYTIDYSYITKCYRSVINDIKSYAKFIKRCVQSESEISKLLSDHEYLQTKENELDTIIAEDEELEEPNVGCLCRNLFNFSKMIIMNYSQTDIRGETNHKRIKRFTYQEYFIYNYGVLTRRMKDYKKCLVLDYNMKVMRYKINLKNLGKVNHKFSTIQYIKKYHFFPNEVIQKISFATVDQIYLFTLFPVILFKVQNSLIYYYNTNCLLHQFPLSFSEAKRIDIKLAMQAFNAKTTMEIENYERLEFLGDAILKLVSSIELFVELPNANRDLLFSKRRILENNKNLFEKAKNKELYKYIFTSPITIKRVMIPGFSKDDSLIFDISYNRSFAKNCFLHKRKILNAESEINNMKKEMDPKIGEFIKAKEVKNENEMENEKKTDKASIEIEYTEKNLEAADVNVALDSTKQEIEKIVQENIEIIPANTCRFIYTKTLADIVESLTAFIFVTSQYNNTSLASSLNSSSIFLTEMSIIKSSFNETMSKIKEIALQDLVNDHCRYSPNEQKRYMRNVLENTKYTFKNPSLFYQAMTHPTCLADECISANKNYVKKSYQRLAFIGEALLCFYVSDFVYKTNRYETESSLHKMRICGINHHIISLIAIDLKLDDCLLKFEGEIKNDISNYKTKLVEIRNKSENKYKIPNEELLDENFVIILCELFHSYIAAILIDSGDIAFTLGILDDIMKQYLLNNATKDTYTEHPKVTILDEFAKRRMYFKKIRENGGNRIAIKFNTNEKFRKKKLYDYQLVIDNFIIYQENIAFSRTTIKKAQEKAKNVFLLICKEIDRRERLKLHQSKFDLKNILDYLKVKYQALN